MYTSGLKVRGLRGGDPQPPALSSATPAQGEWGSRLKEGIRERGEREPPAFSNYFKHCVHS